MKGQISTFCIQKAEDRLKTHCQYLLWKIKFQHHSHFMIIILFYLSKHAEHNLPKYHMFKSDISSIEMH